MDKTHDDNVTIAFELTHPRELDAQQWAEIKRLARRYLEMGEVNQMKCAVLAYYAFITQKKVAGELH